jgi:hypothetical protein
MEDAMLNKEEAFIAGNVLSTEVCGECGQLFGPVATDVGATHDQKCGCERKAMDNLWPRFDFNAAVDLCHACTLTLIRSGSRWHPLYCRSCLHLVEAENAQLASTCGGPSAPSPYIPIGRHSLTHGISYTSGPDADDDSAPVEFTEAMDDLRARLGLLRRIHLARVRKVLEDLGAPKRAVTETFLRRARAIYATRAAIPDLKREFLAHGLPPHRAEIARFT